MPSEIKPLRPNHMPTPNAGGRARASEVGNSDTNRSQGAKTSGPGSDTVTVTSEASRLQKMEQTLSNTPAVDSKRVAELRQAIADGSYQPNAERIADKMMQLEKDLT